MIRSFLGLATAACVASVATAMVPAGLGSTWSMHQPQQGAATAPQTGAQGQSKADATITGDAALKDYQRAEKRSFAEMAKRSGRSVEEVERQFAAVLLKHRQRTIGPLFEYPPGQHIIPDDQMSAMTLSRLGVDKKAKYDRDGVMELPTGAVTDLRKLVSGMKGNRLRPPSELAGNNDVYVSLTSVEGTDLQNATLLGYTVSGTLLRGNIHLHDESLKSLQKTPSGRTGYTAVTRVFSRPSQPEIVFLGESDLIAAGTVKVVSQSHMNTSVGTFRASMIRTKDKAGSTLSVLSWCDASGKEYTLRVNGIDRNSTDLLRRIAETIAKRS